MKSLVHLHTSSVHLGSLEDAQLQPTGQSSASSVVDIAFDRKQGTLYAAVERDQELELWAIPREKAVGGGRREADDQITELGSPRLLTSVSLEVKGRLLSLQYHDYTALLTLVLSDGRILQCSPVDKRVESIGVVDDGLDAGEWSPDEEKLVLITSAPLPNLILMSRDFEPLVEQPLHTSDFGADAPISVGWGKKATQFHGKLGKMAARSSGPQWDDKSFDILTSDRKKNKITWRGDSAFFAISSLDDQDPDQEDGMLSSGRIRRKIRIYTDSGILSSTVEPTPRLSGCLAWKPSGNLLTSSRMGPGTATGAGAEIIFIERNGLRHGEFGLTDGMEYDLESMEKQGRWAIIDLLWSSDSQVLAIHLIKEGREYVDLWSTGNYHWYRKQRIAAPTGKHFGMLKWHPSVPFRLLLSYTDTQDIEFHDLSWDIIRESSSSAVENRGMVAVIDGSNLLLTPFKSMNVPPPYGAHTIKVKDGLIPRHVALGPNGLVAILTCPHEDSTCHVQIWQVSGAQALTAELKYEKSIDGLYQVSQLAIFGPLSLCQIAILHDGGRAVTCIDMLKPSTQMIQHRVEPLGSQLIGRSYGFAIQTAQDLHIHDSSGFKGISLPLIDHSLTTVDFYLDQVGCPHSVGLDKTGRLAVDDKVIAANATSFILYCPDSPRKGKLIYTTTEHRLQFCPLQADQFANSSSALTEESRKVERGSQIVTVVMATSSLVLQMPRGNLETIYPRALVLDDVRDSMDRLDYKRAFTLCRRHRVEQSLLYYHNPEDFLKNIDHFVREVGQVDDLNSFLTNVGRSSDKSKTLSSEANNRICEAMQSSLTRLDPVKYVRSILTAHVRKQPPDYTRALEVLLQMKSIDPKATEDAIEYIIFLTNAPLLFDHALGMYDYGLVLMIARHSQRDPREYIPLVRQLQSLPLHEQHFRINDRLKRYVKALAALKEGGESCWPTAQSYIVRHEIYEEALVVFASQAGFVAVIHDLYGKYLLGLGRHEDAATNFMLAGNLANAAPAYRKALKWREGFTIAARLGTSSPALAIQAAEDAEELETAGRYDEAATVWLDYAKDVEQATSALVKASKFDEAHRIALLWNRADLLETHVVPGAKTCLRNALDDISSWTDQFDKERARLKVIRQKKIEQPDEFFLTGNNPLLEEIDATSELSTAASRFTRYSTSATAMTGVTTSTNRTQRLKKREERKKASGKKGSVYEEEYLVASVGRLVERINQLQEQMPVLIISFVSLGLHRHAMELQVALLNLLEHVRPALPEVYASVSESEQLQTGMNGMSSDSAGLVSKFAETSIGSRPVEQRLTTCGLKAPDWFKTYLKK